jgi:TRAP-type C4-dicarboxylate transport system permease small subunit
MPPPRASRSLAPPLRVLDRIEETIIAVLMAAATVLIFVAVV